MLLTLTASSIRSMLVPKRGKVSLELRDLPGYVRETLGLHGLNMTTDLLAGRGRGELEQLREQADKAGCACLLLVERDAHAIGMPDDDKAEASLQRLGRVVDAASVLGCNAVGVRVKAANDEDTFERVADRLRRVVNRAEKHEINVLIQPHDGLTQDPERVTELVKKIGGFRVGTLPDFEAAAKSGDAENYLRRLTPYASVVTAAMFDFKVEEVAQAEPDDALERMIDELGAELGMTDEGEEGLSEPRQVVTHTTYDLVPMIAAISAVGYDGTLAIDFRGKSDGTIGVLNGRAALEAAIQRVKEKG